MILTSISRASPPQRRGTLFGLFDEVFWAAGGRRGGGHRNPIIIMGMGLFGGSVASPLPPLLLRYLCTRTYFIWSFPCKLDGICGSAVSHKREFKIKRYRHIYEEKEDTKPES